MNNKFYIFNGTSAPLYNGVSQNNFGWINLDNSSDYKRVTTSNPFSLARNTYGYPVCNFTTSQGNVIVFFAGITSGITMNVNNQIGIVMQDKDYSDLENDTLIIYSTDGTMGTYITPIYQNEKVITGKIYQRFNDVNFWDSENQTLIKNLHTYYGDGTNWIQIK